MPDSVMQIVMITCLFAANLVRIAAFPEIVQPPVNASVLLGETAVFTCEAKYADVIYFLIDGNLPAYQTEAFQRGFTQTNIITDDSDGDGSTLHRILSVQTNSANNNTWINCYAQNFSSAFLQVSEPAFLRVERVVMFERPVYANLIVTHVGDMNKFRCVAKAKLLNFIVNGVSAADQSSYDKGFVQSSITYFNGTAAQENVIQRTLSVTSSLGNNNTYIICKAMSSSDIDIAVKYRIMTLLIVQGRSYKDLSLNTSQSNMIPPPLNMSNFSKIGTAVKMLVQPVSVTVLLGEDGLFVCKAAFANIIGFKVNGDSSELDTYVKAGFNTSLISSSQENNETILSRTLIVDGTDLAKQASNNDSKINCFASNGTSYIESDPAAYFHVQGHLGAVPHLYVIWLDSYFMNISWGSPFTLSGVNITGYNISITELVGKEELILDTFTTKRFYVWNTSCTRVTVTAYNGLNGNASSRMISNELHNEEYA